MTPAQTQTVQIFDRQCTLQVTGDGTERKYVVVGPDARTLAEAPMRLLAVADAARLVQAEAGQ